MGRHYNALVVGAGPGGLATVVSLLDAGLDGILWADPSFGGGRLNELYREISSNTKTHIYLDAIKSSPTCQKIIDSTPHPHAVDELEKRDPESTVQLSVAGDMVMMLLRGVLARKEVEKYQGKVQSAWLNGSTWTVTLDRDDYDEVEITTDRIHLCTGSHPRTSNLHMPYNAELEVLDLDRCMIKSTLPDLFDNNSNHSSGNGSSSSSKNTIAVIGNSHSGILVCRNLYELTQEGKLNLGIVNFRRSPIRYAEYRDDGIVFDNTGLKGDTAAWAKDNMGSVKQIDLDNDDGEEEGGVYRRHLPGCTHIVYAIGYEPSPYPRLSIDTEDEDGDGNKKEERIDADIEFDQLTSGFRYRSDVVRGLYGLGIAHPELAQDPAGHVEAAVGLAKFFKFAERVKDNWLRCA